MYESWETSIMLFVEQWEPASANRSRTGWLASAKAEGCLTDLEPGQDVEVLLHVSTQHLLYDSRPQSALISTGACLYTCSRITHMTSTCLNQCSTYLNAEALPDMTITL